jgi:hypothetical protein
MSLCGSAARIAVSLALILPPVSRRVKCVKKLGVRLGNWFNNRTGRTPLTISRLPSD